MKDFNLGPCRGRSNRDLIYWQLLNLAGPQMTGKGPRGLRLCDLIYWQLQKLSGLGRMPRKDLKLGEGQKGNSLRLLIYNDLLNAANLPKLGALGHAPYKERIKRRDLKAKEEMPDSFIRRALRQDCEALRGVEISQDLLQAKRLQLRGMRLFRAAGRPGKAEQRREQRRLYAHWYGKARRAAGIAPERSPRDKETLFFYRKFLKLSKTS